MRLPVMDRFLDRISEEELREQREGAGEDAQFLDLVYQEDRWIISHCEGLSNALLGESDV